MDITLVIYYWIYCGDIKVFHRLWYDGCNKGRRNDHCYEFIIYIYIYIYIYIQ